MNGFPLLTTLTLAPLLGGLIVVGLDARRKDLARGLALACSLASLGLALWVWKNFDPASAELQFAERHDWIPSLGIQYFVGVDGLGLLMVLLTALVVPMALLASWKIDENVPVYFSLTLFLQAGLFGTFVRQASQIQEMRRGVVVREALMTEPPLWASWLGLFLICALCLWLLSRKVKAYEVVK